MTPKQGLQMLYDDSNDHFFDAHHFKDSCLNFKVKMEAAMFITLTTFSWEY
jgi:hypothetical protein